MPRWPASSSPTVSRSSTSLCAARGLTLRHRDPQRVRAAAQELAARLRERFGRRVLGPMAPPVDRVRGEWLAGLLLKIESGKSFARARELLGGELERFRKIPEYKSVVVVVNVDPQ